MTQKQSHFLGEAAPLIEATIGDYLREVASRSPDHPALIMPHQSIRWSYRELNERVDQLATGLLALGIGCGDRVGIWSPNRYEWVLTQFATARVGAILVCINPSYRLSELEYALNMAECKAIISAELFKSSRYLDMLNTLAPELTNCYPGELRAEKIPHLRLVIRMGEASTAGMLNFETVCTMGGEPERSELEEYRLSPDDVINIQFTSGTTGSPKGAALTHRNLLNNAWFTGKSMHLNQEDKLCIPVPLYHCFGMVLGTLCCVAHSATMVLPCEVFEPGSVLKAVAKERCTALHGVPTMFMAELDHPELEEFDLSSLRTGIIAGATCPEALMKRLIGEMGLSELIIAYGQTECSPINHATRIEDSIEKRTSTVGRPHYNWEVKIILENGEIAAIGERGEVCARGYGVMSGYWNDPEQTAATIDKDGFLHSGDIGLMDAEGFVTITGRIKDMIIRGGENVYPREVEEFLYTHPAIVEAQVFGVPDDRYGEQVAAWIKLAEGWSMTAEEVVEYCKDNITHFKIPKYIKFVESYPMTVTGKIQKFQIRNAYAEELAEKLKLGQ